MLVVWSGSAELPVKVINFLTSSVAVCRHIMHKRNSFGKVGLQAHIQGVNQTQFPASQVFVFIRGEMCDLPAVSEYFFVLRYTCSPVRCILPLPGQMRGDSRAPVDDGDQRMRVHARSFRFCGDIFRPVQHICDTMQQDMKRKENCKSVKL